MKRFLLSALVALGVVSASAQSYLVDNPANRAYFGIRVGGEVTCPGKITGGPVGIKFFNNGGGVEFGGIYNIPVVANFYVEPGLKLYYNTYSVKKDWVDLFQDDIVLDGVSVRKFGMRVPVMAGYHFDFTRDVRLHLFTGPELEVGFSGKEHISGKNIDMSSSIYGDDGNMNRVDVLWGAGVGLAYDHFYFGVSGSFGLCNMYNDSSVKFHENRVTFSLGYNF
ncbi:MAG: PorT family protein [Duncaniella sp.]|nr:PorT family protein [Muribaculaceae bacterium Isolate-110 (HZI)]